jgi:hypothetical protein
MPSKISRPTDPEHIPFTPPDALACALARAHSVLASDLLYMCNKIEDEGLREWVGEFIYRSMIGLACDFATLHQGREVSHPASNEWLCAAYVAAGIHSW